MVVKKLSSEAMLPCIIYNGNNEADIIKFVHDALTDKEKQNETFRLNVSTFDGKLTIGDAIVIIDEVPTVINSYDLNKFFIDKSKLPNELFM